jgi:hypothetical protein
MGLLFILFYFIFADIMAWCVYVCIYSQFGKFFVYLTTNA